MTQASSNSSLLGRSGAQKLCAVFAANPQPVETGATLRRMIDAFYPHSEAFHVMADLPAGAMAAPAYGLFRGGVGRGAVALAGAYFNADELGPAGVSQAELAGDLIGRQGPAAVGRLNGVFAVVYHDPDRPRVVVAVDRYGFAPLFYATVGQTLLVASEVKAIAAVASLTPDPAAIGAFFYVGHLLGEQTLFAEVKALGPGEYLEWTPAGATLHRYWDIAETPAPNSLAVTSSEVATAFGQAVGRRVPREGCDTLLLSGGKDSRLILATLLAHGHRPRLVTLEHAGFQRGLDSELARHAAQAVNLTTELRPTHAHFYETANALEVFRILDGMVPTFGLFIGQVYPELDPSMERVWEGMAMDTSLGGYLGQNTELRRNLPRLLAPKAQNRRFLHRVYRRDWADEVEQRFADKLAAEVGRFPNTEDGWVRFMVVHRKRRRIGASPNHLYSRKVLPLTPGVDTQFLDTMLAVPVAQRQEHKLYFALLNEFCPPLLQVPVLSGETYFGVHNGVVDLSRPIAHGSSRVRRWLKGAGLAPHARAVSARLWHVEHSKQDALTGQLVTRLLRTTGFEGSLYNRAYVEKALRKVEAGSLYWLMPLTLVFYTELWQHIFQRPSVETLRTAVFDKV